ncbi:hypothetical protein AAFF_G00227640 [Aldrovandia affinis]|uniref:Uncharacterized protein n=1 Tax=Aldrovandia affinis TaxID=143900 RepID=A0AAD7TD10_9TELE|nr:hypothetical protein AAFF_G00227640 [Aldrovandia affinis]
MFPCRDPPISLYRGTQEVGYILSTKKTHSTSDWGRKHSHLDSGSCSGGPPAALRSDRGASAQTCSPSFSRRDTPKRPSEGEGGSAAPREPLGVLERPALLKLFSSSSQRMAAAPQRQTAGSRTEMRQGRLSRFPF